MFSKFTLNLYGHPGESVKPRREPNTQGGSLPERQESVLEDRRASRRDASSRGRDEACRGEARRSDKAGAYYTRRDPNGIGILLNKAGAYYTRRDLHV